MRRIIVSAAAVLGVCLLALPAVFVAGSGGSAAQSPAAVGASCVIRTAAGTGPPGDAVTLDANQMTHARTIAAVGRQRMLPPSAVAVALTVALGVSGLSGHPDTPAGPASAGPFGLDPQRFPGLDLTDPAAAAAAFYATLAAVADYTRLAVADAAQRARPAPVGGRYPLWAPTGTALAAALNGQSLPRSAQFTCAGGEAAGSAQTPGGTALRALAAARAQLGVWYVWAGGDADGPTTGAKRPCTASPRDPGCGFDCSGLMLHAWARAGVALPRTSRQQYRAGRNVPVAQARPGDLVFLATDTTDPGSIHHVAMVESPGRIIEAQQTGVPVHIRPYRGPEEPEIMPYVVRLSG